MSTTPRKTLAKKSSTPIARVTRPMVYPVKSTTGNVCHSCNALPAGSMEVAAILLVLVFSLSAVLFTSVYATRIQTAKVSALESQLSSYQNAQ